MSPDVIDDRKQRKKVQNRLNQRARRSRLGEQGTTVAANSGRPYKVVRWRPHNKVPTTDAPKSSDEATKPQDSQLALTRSSQNLDEALKSPVGLCAPRSPSDTQVQLARPSPAADQLLNLIQFNVLQAMFHNKAALLNLTVYQSSHTKQNAPPVKYVAYFPSQGVIIPTLPGLPVALQPTVLQMTVQHGTWIDFVPFPRMRDTLIQYQGQFDLADLVGDLIGDVADFSAFFLHKTASAPPNAGSKGFVQQDEKYNRLAPDRKGLIVWGDPSREESWEVTAGFLRKWGWTLAGCHEIITNSNRRRLHRGDCLLSREVKEIAKYG